MRAITSKRGLAAVLVLAAVFFCGEGYYQAYGQDTGGANATPVACIAEGDRTIEAADVWEAQVTLDGSCSSDTDSSPGTNDDINDFKWYEVVDICDPNRNFFLGSSRIIECNLPIGPHVIILTVTDIAGASDSNEAIFTIEYMPPPVFEPNDSNAPVEPDTAIITSGGDSNNPQEEPSGILAAGQGAPVKSGRIIGWGASAFDSGDFSTTNAVAIAAGGYHSLALKSDGSIIGWGYNYYGQATPPAGNNFIAIAAGYRHSLALKSDGSIVGWGDNSHGQATPPSGNNFVAVAAGDYHSLALRSDGSIVSWGYNLYGQTTPPSGNNFIAIAAGVLHSLALKSDGSIVGWGYNGSGRATPPAGNYIAIAAGVYHSLALKSDGSIVGCGYNSDGQVAPPAGNNFIAVAAGGFHSLALKSDASIVGWGYNYYGQAAPPAGNNFIAIAAGYRHSLALKSDGSIVGWGDNGYGQAVPPAGNSFIAIAAGGEHSLALKSDGSIVGWGYNDYGQATPSAGNNFIAIAAGGEHSLALKSDGSIVGWGDNGYGQAAPPSGNDFIAIAAGKYHSLALKSDGTIIGWGYNLYGQATPPAGNNFITIAAGWNHSLALKSDGSIVGWGYNYFGQATPSAGNNFIAIAAGVWHSLALKSDGSIVGWGNNGYGQAAPPAGNNFIAIAAGGRHSLALKSDDTIIGWGYNLYGQAAPPSGNNFIAIAAGEWHSLAIVSEVGENRTPGACVVGGDQIVEAGSNCEARIVLDGSCSSDEDSTPGTNDDIVSFEWYEANNLLGSGEIIECNLPFGEHIVVLEVTDKRGKSDSNEMVITVVETTPPVIVCPCDITVYAKLPAGIAVAFEVNAVDLCDSQVDVVSSPPSGSVFAPGETLVSCTATDDSGNSADCSFTVTVIAPVEMPMHFTPGALNPRSQTNWLKAHFILPDGYQISDIDTNTPAVLYPLEIESDYITTFIDKGRFGEAGVEIGFNRSGFCDAIGDFGPGDVTVSGRLITGRYFYGTDTIKVIANDFEYLGVLADYWLRGGCGAPDWCGGADADTSGMVDLVDLALFDGCCLQVF